MHLIEESKEFIDKQKNLNDAIYKSMVTREGCVCLVQEVVQSFTKREIKIHEQCNSDDTALTRALRHSSDNASRHSSDTEIVRILINAGFDVNHMSDYGTPLYIASISGNVEMVRLLIDAKCLLNKGLNDCTPLYVATANGHTRVVEQLIYGANARDEALSISDIVNALQKACSGGYAGIVDQLLRAGCTTDIFSEADKMMKSPMYAAVHKEREEIVEQLIDAGFDVNTAPTTGFDINTAPNGISYLFTAIYRGCTSIVSKLLVAGCNPNTRISGWSIKNDYTPLYVAIQHNYPEIVRKLVEFRCDVNLYTIKSPLYIAARNGNNEIVSILLQAGAHTENKNNGKGFTDVGQTPLHGAVASGVRVVVQTLIGAGSDIDSPIDARSDIDTHLIGNTPLIQAVTWNRVDILHLLIAAGADKEKSNNNGETPIIVAALRDNVQMLQVLLAYNCDPNKTTVSGETALFISVVKGNLDIVKILLEHCRDKNQTTHDGKTLLFIAAKYGNLEIVNILLQSGCDVEIPSTDGFTPLDVAIQENQRCINIAKHCHFNPLSVAIQENRERVVRILSEKHFQNRYLAFAMSRHSRLGIACPYNGLNDDLMKQIFDIREEKLGVNGMV